MNRLLLSVLLWVGLLGSAFGQSISSVSGGSAAGVIGPSGAPAPGTVTDNAIVRWDGTTGTLVQNSLVTIDDTGTLTAPNLVTTLANGGLFVRNDSGAIGLGVSDDVLIKRAAAASLQLGATDGAAPVAQTLGVQSVVAGTANTAGANFTIAGSKSTGSAAGGSIIFQTAAAGGAGSSQNALATALTIDSTRASTFTNTAIVKNSGSGSAADALSFGLGGKNIAYDSNAVGRHYLLSGDSSGSGGAAELDFGSGGLITWRSTARQDAGAVDLVIQRDAANTLALRNGASAQSFNIYKSYTDGSNYSQGFLDHITNAGFFTVGTYKAGTGTLNGMQFFVGANIFQISTAGHMLWNTDNTYDIGASGATRPRNYYGAGDGTFGGVITGGSYLQIAAGSPYIWAGRSSIHSPSDGVIRLADAAQTNFGRLQFGGTTSSFPAIARNGIKLEAKLADDSTYASFATRGVIVAGAVPTLTLAGGTCAGTVIAGGSTAGTVTLTGVCVATNTMALTVMPTAPTGYACDAIDRTLGSSLLTETATTATSVTFTFGGTTGATDVLAYKCLAY